MVCVDEMIQKGLEVVVGRRRRIRRLTSPRTKRLVVKKMHSFEVNSIFRWCVDKNRSDKSKEGFFSTGIIWYGSEISIT